MEQFSQHEAHAFTYSWPEDYYLSHTVQDTGQHTDSSSSLITLHRTEHSLSISFYLSHNLLSNSRTRAKNLTVSHVIFPRCYNLFSISHQWCPSSHTKEILYRPRGHPILATNPQLRIKGFKVSLPAPKSPHSSPWWFSPAEGSLVQLQHSTTSLQIREVLLPYVCTGHQSQLAYHEALCLPITSLQEG